MSITRINDPRAFRDFLDTKLSNEGADLLTLDDALGLWEYENQTDEKRRETHEAIQSGLDDMNAGRTRPAEDVVRGLCRKHGLPTPQ